MLQCGNWASGRIPLISSRVAIGSDAGHLLRHPLPRTCDDRLSQRVHRDDLPRRIQHDHRTRIVGAARAGEGDRQPDVCGDVQSGARQGRIPGLGAQVRRPCWLCRTLWQSEMRWADASYARSMIVDPMGRIQTELDETEGDSLRRSRWVPGPYFSSRPMLALWLTRMHLHRAACCQTSTSSRRRAAIYPSRVRGGSTAMPTWPSHDVKSSRV